jgi:hypothetical protein
MVDISIVREARRFKRTMRSPQHSFNVVNRPWQVQPMFLAPVLPGETLKNLMLMARTVSDPLADKLCGWWVEYYFYYVKHRDLSTASAALVNMHLGDASGLAALNSAADARYFHNGGLNFAKLCLDEVIKWDFRDADQANPAAIDNLPLCKINHDGWWQSFKLASELPVSDHELPGDVTPAPVEYPAYSAQWTQWEAMTAAGLTKATFEDYLKSFGVSVPSEVDEEMSRPELVRYVRKFTYPTNTVEPTTGVPSSAAVWSVEERADKDRRFTEPGFLFGCQVVRPKVYLNNITGSLASYMNTAFNWLPAVLKDEAFLGLKSFATATGPAPQAYGQDYWLDVKDLFLYGEQFHTGAIGSRAKVAMPTAAGEDEFASAADMDALFTNAAGGFKYFRTDGMVNLQIASAMGGDTTL